MSIILALIAAFGASIDVTNVNGNWQPTAQCESPPKIRFLSATGSQMLSAAAGM